MIKTLAILCALVCMTAAQSENEIKYFFINNENLIETSQGYALTAPSLLPSDWKTVSVNGGRVEIIGANCQRKESTSQELGNQKLISAVKRLHSAESGQIEQSTEPIRRHGVFTCSFDGQSQSSQTSNANADSFMSNGLSITTWDNNDMVLSKQDLPDGIIRIYLSDDVATFVYQDGRVQMKPVACLQANEKTIIEQLKAEAQRAKQGIDSDEEPSQPRSQPNQNSQSNVNWQVNGQSVNQNSQTNINSQVNGHSLNQRPQSNYSWQMNRQGVNQQIQMNGPGLNRNWQMNGPNGNYNLQMNGQGMHQNWQTSNQNMNQNLNNRFPFNGGQQYQYGPQYNQLPQNFASNGYAPVQMAGNYGRPSAPGYQQGYQQGYQLGYQPVGGGYWASG